jgi:hypothetical protein
MKSMQMFLIGYVVVAAGCIMALWKLGMLDRVGPAWTAIGIVIVIGLGIMLAVSTGKTNTVEVDEKH